MEPRTIRCTVCGLKHEDSSEASLLTCQACGNTYLAADGIYLSQKTQKEIDRLKNLRTRLDELKAYNDYNMIYHHAEDILTILPEDIMARYFYAYAAYHLNQVKLFREFLKTPLEDVSPTHVKEIILHMATYMDIREYDGINTFTKIHNASLLKNVKRILEGRIEKEDQYTLLNSDIFICHKSTDIEITNQVVEALENDGYTCWVSERNLRPDDNDNYWRNIEEAIDHCQLFLVISSQAAMLSRDVQRELKYANKIQKQKLEYKIDDSKHITLFKQSFDGLKWVDGIKDTNFDTLTTRVYGLIHNIQQSAPSKAPTSEFDIINKKLDIALKTSNYKSSRTLLQELRAIDESQEVIWLSEILIEHKKHDRNSLLQALEASSKKQLETFQKSVSFTNYKRLFPQSQLIQSVNKLYQQQLTKYNKTKRIKFAFLSIAILTFIVVGFITYQTTPQEITFELNQAGVTFNPGNLSSGYTNADGSVILPTPSSDTHDFLGWYDNPSFTGNPITRLEPGFPTNIQLYARWEAKTYKIIYYTNGSDIINDQDVQVYSILDLPDPEREGYTFDGWFLNRELTIPLELETMPGYQLILYAKWAVLTYTVTYRDSDNTLITSNTYDYGTEDTEVSIPNDPVKEGYTFTGWDITLPDTITENLTLKATYTVNEYTITFNTSGGSSITSVELDYNSTITLPSNPEREGYTFDGWYLNQALTTPFTATTMPSNNLNLYAKWAVLTYTVTYRDSDNTLITSSTYDYGTEDTQISIPNDPVKEGYTFTGWDITLPDTITENLTLKATYTVNEYTITFNTSGGSSITSVELDYNSTITLPSNPEREGYTFDGWYLNQALTTPFTATTMPSNNLTLYAKWAEIDQFTVSFDSTGGTEVISISVSKDDTIAAPQVTKEGYTLEGWYTSINGGVTLDEKWSFLNNTVSGDLTLYANWTINQYTITFNSNGGSEIDPITLHYNSVITLPVDPIKDLFEFDGWYIDEALNNRLSSNLMPANDIVLYAKWNSIIDYTIYFETFEGSQIGPLVVYVGEEFPTLPIPDKEGYTFAGWFTDENLPINFEAINENSTDMILYAKWIVNPEGLSSVIATYPSFQFFGFSENKYATLLLNSGSNYINFNVTYDKVFSNNPGLYTYKINVITERITNTYTIQVSGEYSTTWELGFDFSFETDERDDYYFIIIETPDNIDNRPLTFHKFLVYPLNIEFRDSDNTLITSNTYEYGTEGSEIIIPSDPAKEGYTFTGWNIALPDTVTGNLTLKATYTINQYIVTFNTDGGTEIDPITLDYNADIVLPDDPTKEGQIFGGWYIDHNYTQLFVLNESKADDIQLYAFWYNGLDFYEALNIDFESYLVDQEGNLVIVGTKDNGIYNTAIIRKINIEGDIIWEKNIGYGPTHLDSDYAFNTLIEVDNKYYVIGKAKAPSNWYGGLIVVFNLYGDELNKITVAKVPTSTLIFDSIELTTEGILINNLLLFDFDLNWINSNSSYKIYN